MATAATTDYEQRLRINLTVTLRLLRAAREDGDCELIRARQHRFDWLLDRLPR